LCLDGRKTDSNIVKAAANNLTLEAWQNSFLDSRIDAKYGSITNFITRQYNWKWEYEAIKNNPELLIKIIEVVTKSPDKALDSLEAISELMSILQTLIEYIIFDEANEYFTAYSLPHRLFDILDQTRWRRWDYFQA